MKKRYSSEEKTRILKEHLEGGISISDLAEKYGVHVNVIYSWKKSLFVQNVVRQPNAKAVERSLTVKDTKIQELEAKLKQREELIAELLTENIDLKKKGFGQILIKSGLNRK